MSVYKEGYMMVGKLETQQIRIFDDACDYGVPVKKDDKNWKLLSQLIDQYGEKKTRKSWKSRFGNNVSCEVELLDEWAYNDERKTAKEAEDNFLISYIACTTGACKGYDGFISVDKIN